VPPPSTRCRRSCLRSAMVLSGIVRTAQPLDRKDTGFFEGRAAPRIGLQMPPDHTVRQHSGAWSRPSSAPAASARCHRRGWPWNCSFDIVGLPRLGNSRLRNYPVFTISSAGGMSSRQDRMVAREKSSHPPRTATSKPGPLRSIFDGIRVMTLHLFDAKRRQPKSTCVKLHGSNNQASNGARLGHCAVPSKDGMYGKGRSRTRVAAGREEEIGMGGGGLRAGRDEGNTEKTRLYGSG